MAAWLPLAEIATKVQTGQLSAVGLVEQSLRAIAAKKDYNAVLSVITTRSRERALEIDARVARGETAGRLAGVPFIAKDNFLVFGAETTAASNILKGFEAPYQSTAIERLEAEGAICVAKANLDAFAHGASTENSDFGPTKNPHDPTRVPGGSSGGSAAAVALELAPFALGTDTGGSIRQPASFSGCVGYKPTYGLVSRSGIVAMASSLDVVGPLARTVDDVALVLDIIAGADALDSTVIARSEISYTQLAGDMRGKKIGIIAEYMSDPIAPSASSTSSLSPLATDTATNTANGTRDSGSGLQPEVRAALEAAIVQMRAAGAIVEYVSIPSISMALPAYYVICPAEISSNLSRYDGQRYGYSHPNAQNLEESYAKSRNIGFGQEAKRRIMIGTYVLSSGYYDAYYKRAQTVRTKLINEFNKAFEAYDFLLGPVAPTTAFKIGQNTDDPLRMYLEDIMTVSANLVGIPAISLPCNVAGLPVGLQLMAPQKQDRALLVLAKQTEAILKVRM